MKIHLFLRQSTTKTEPWQTFAVKRALVLSNSSQLNVTKIELEPVYSHASEAMSV
jgi:hypothetical protein